VLLTVFSKQNRKWARQLIWQIGYEQLATPVWSWLTEHGHSAQSNVVLPERYAHGAWANLLNGVKTKQRVLTNLQGLQGLHPAPASGLESG